MRGVTGIALCTGPFMAPDHALAGKLASVLRDNRALCRCLMVPFVADDHPIPGLPQTVGSGRI